MNTTAKEMLDFIDKSPTCFQVVSNLRKELLNNGFTELFEKEKWSLKPGGKYFVTRNDSSIISFTIPQKKYDGFYITASHSDSPCFKIKPYPEIESSGAYVKLNIEKYGGMLCSPWFDRPLSVAGRVLICTGDGIESRSVVIDRDLLMIPSLAIHMNHDANKGQEINVQNDMLPIYGDISSKGTFMSTIADAANVDKDSIIGTDLFLYNRVLPVFWGAENEYISSARLDDQECVYTTFAGFLEAACSTSGIDNQKVKVHAVFDNEEVGSATRQGAASTFLSDTLERIDISFDHNKEQYLMEIAGSMMLSCDNAHAVHPNYESKTDPVNKPVMNKGIVIKYSANQKYTTDAVSEAFLTKICTDNDIPFQHFTNRADMLGGSTLGNISSTNVPVRTVDIGLSQLAMHSPYESAGAKDPEYMKRCAYSFYTSNIKLS